MQIAWSGDCATEPSAALVRQCARCIGRTRRCLRPGARWPASVETFDDAGNALTEADAQADQRVAATRAFQLAQRGECQAHTRGAERMTDGDGAAVGVQPRVVEGDAQLLG